MTLPLSRTPSATQAMTEKGLVPPTQTVQPPLSATTTTPNSLSEAEGLETKPLSHTYSNKPKTAGGDEPFPTIADDEYPKAFALFAIFSALALSIFLVALDMTIVATAIPSITDEFRSLDQVGWYGSAFFLTLASFQSTWGKVYKYFPLKLNFLLSIAIFEIGSLICAAARNSTTLIVGRAIAGAGGAGVASGAYTIIAFSAPPSQRPAFTGVLGATYGVASVVGPLLGGVFTEKLTWRWCFWINLPIGGAAAAIIFFTFKVPHAVKPVQASWKEKLLQMDLGGTFMIMAAAVCYLLALQWGGVTKSWSDSTVVGTLVGFVLLIILFGINEWYLGDRALLQGRLLKKRPVLVSIFYVVFLAAAFFLFVYYLPIYFQAVSGVTPSQSGVRNLPLIIAVSLLTIFSGAMISTYGHYVPWMILGSICATVGSGLIYTLGLSSPSSQWIGYQALAGIGFGLGIQIPIIIVQASVDIIDISSVSAVVLFFQTIGASFFVSAAQAAFTNRLVANLIQNVPSVNPSTVLATGATSLTTAFSGDELLGVLNAYVDGLRTAFALGIALAGLSLISALFAEWIRLSIDGPAAVA